MSLRSLLARVERRNSETPWLGLSCRIAGSHDYEDGTGVEPSVL